MGECGCAAYAGDFKFKGPKGITYVLEIYPSCNYCNSPAGVVIYAFDKKDVKTWDAESLPDLPFVEGQAYVPVLHPDKLIKLCQQSYDDEEMQWELDDIITANFRDAVLEQIDENRMILRQDEAR